MPMAMFNLGYLYEWGMGVKRDFPLAKRFYDKSAAEDFQGKNRVPISLALFGLRMHEKFTGVYDLLFGDGPLVDRIADEKEAEGDDNNKLEKLRRREKEAERIKAEKKRAKEKEIEKGKKVKELQKREKEKLKKEAALAKAKANSINKTERKKRSVSMNVIAPVIAKHIADSDTMLIVLLLLSIFTVVRYRKARVKLQEEEEERKFRKDLLREEEEEANNEDDNDNEQF